MTFKWKILRLATALIGQWKLTNEIFTAADNKARTLLVQLDLPATFDTTDSHTLFKRLKRPFGFRGIVYLTGYGRTLKADNSS